MINHLGHAIDYLGQEIHTGDVIVYPGRGGSSIWMQTAVVTWIDDSGDLSVSRINLDRDGTFKSLRRTVVNHTERVVVLHYGQYNDAIRMAQIEAGFIPRLIKKDNVARLLREYGDTLSAKEIVASTIGNLPAGQLHAADIMVDETSANEIVAGDVVESVPRCKCPESCGCNHHIKQSEVNQCDTV